MGNRVTLTIKLVDGKDDDLIDWLASLPKGTRQGYAKKLLREAIQPDRDRPTIEKQLSRIVQDTAWLRASMSDLPAWLENLLSHVAAVQPKLPVVEPPRTGQLSTDAVTLREKRIAKATW